MSKRLFITYAWVDNNDDDFDYIVQLLKRAGVDVVYDRVALVPGKRVWEQIGKLIDAGSIDGYAYLVTPNSLNSPACIEEYYLALRIALARGGESFPIMALLVHGASFKDLPPNLNIRLGVSLSEPNWTEVVVAALERRAPVGAAKELAPYALRWHPNGWGNGRSVLEVRPRLGALTAWRFGVPIEFRESIKGFMEGPSGIISSAGGLVMGGFMILPIDGAATDDNQVWFVGAQGPIGNGISAFIGMNPPFPPHVLVGRPGETVTPIELPPLR